MLREIIRDARLPDYELEEEPGDIIAVRPMRLIDADIKGQGAPHISPQALDEARRLMPGADAYALQAEWQSWWASSGRPTIRSADAAFLGWVKKRTGLRTLG